MARWVLTSTGCPPLANATLSMPLRRRLINKRRWRDWACYAAKAANIPPLTCPTITYTRVSSAEPDYDGLVMSGKPLIDGLVLAGVLPDDAPKHLRPIYRWRVCERGQQHTELAIEGVEAEGAA